MDVARAAAIVMVLLAHGVSSLKVLSVGVDLFFVLSGFLIGRIYLRAQAQAAAENGRFSFWEFWSARWFRTFPPYLVALGLFALAQPWFQNNEVRPYYALFLQNYIDVAGFAPSWSLCVEEHFYLALPIAGLIILKYVGRRHLLWLLPLLALTPELARVLTLTAGELPRRWYWQSHLHAEGLIFGVWLAYLFLDRRDVWDRMRKPAIALSVLPFVLLGYKAMSPQQPMAFQVSSFLLFAIGYTAWIRVLYDVRWSPTGRVGGGVKWTVQWLALTSYSIYLVHALLLTDIRVLLEGWPRGIVKTTVIMTGTLAGSMVFYFLVERPTIALRDWARKPRPTPSQTPLPRPIRMPQPAVRQAA